MKKKAHLLAVVCSLALWSTPAMAQTQAPGPQEPGDQQQQQAMPKPGCRMMGGGGLGMGPGMMGQGMGPGMMGQGMGMGPGMMGRGMGMRQGMMGGGMGMGRGMQPCLMGNCWQGGMGGGMGMGMMNCPGPRMPVKNAFRELRGYQQHAQALGLSTEQLQQLEDIENAFSKNMIKTRADLQVAALEFRQQMKKDLPDPQQVGDLIDRKAELWTQLQKTAVGAVTQARQVLTQSQRQKAKTLPAAPMPMMQMPMDMDMDMDQEQEDM